MSTLSHYITAFEEFRGSELSAGIAPVRREAFDRFSAKGFPTTRDEEWKYTNIASISAGNFLPRQTYRQSSNLSIDPFLIAGNDLHLLVFINGRYSASHSRVGNLPAGAVVGSLADHSQHPVVKEHLGKISGNTAGAMADLNTAFISDGAFIYAPEKCHIEKPVHCLFINDTTDEATLVAPRNLFVASKFSNVRIIESFHAVGAVHHGFTNAVTEVVTEQEAVLDLTKVQLENNQTYHIGYTAAAQQRQSEFHITTITLDGAIVRNNLNIALNGERCAAHLYGLYLLNGSQLVDNHSLVDHAVPHCESNELYKGIIDDKAQGVFNGKIFVRKDAQKTNAYQSNKNILLSDEAAMNTKPQLEIFADDVKCSHGTTTGQLDEEALFYLRSRGIGENDARALLNIAFSADVIRKIAYEPLREKLMELMELKLKKAAF